MSCLCHAKADRATDYRTLPDAPCSFCAEKHFSTAMRMAEEFGYLPVNRQRIIGELVCAAWHIYAKDIAIAEALRDLRHLIQQRKVPDEKIWADICKQFDALLRPERLDFIAEICSGKTFPDYRGKIHLISNVPYPEQNKLKADDGDLLVFLNRAQSAKFYSGFPNRICFHRTPEPDYGDASDETLEHFYCFEKGFGNIRKMPDAIYQGVIADYDWNYPIEKGKTRSATTGYIVTRGLENIFPNGKIVLVNFGFEVIRSTYRCPWHNWKFEDGRLRKFQHLHLEQTTTTGE